jgi:hypothetical protein
MVLVRRSPRVKWGPTSARPRIIYLPDVEYRAPGLLCQRLLDGGGGCDPLGPARRRVPGPLVNYFDAALAELAHCSSVSSSNEGTNTFSLG